LTVGEEEEVCKGTTSSEKGSAGFVSVLPNVTHCEAG
jgi:hypothetical protein